MKAIEILKVLAPQLAALHQQMPDGEGKVLVGTLVQLLPGMLHEDRPEWQDTLGRLAEKVLPHLLAVLPPGTAATVGTVTGLALDLLPLIGELLEKERVTVVRETSPDAHPPELV